MTKKLIGGTLLALSALITGGQQAQGARLFVGPEAASGNVTYRSITFTKGSTAFTDAASALAAASAGDIIYFSAGNVGAFTVSKDNITLVGANAWCDGWSGKRNTSAETNVTGAITVTGSGCVINGFRFTGAGQVVSDAQRGEASRIDGFTFIYNKAEGTSLNNTTSIVRLGTPFRPSSSIAAQQDPTVWAAIERYSNVEISHNFFNGADADNQPACVTVCGSGTNLGAAAGTRIQDNRFVSGGSSVNLYNTQGNYDISQNTFLKVGAGLRKSGSATGEFCIRLYYVAASKSSGQGANGRIHNNVFDGCKGQSSKYALIRIFSGDTNETVYQPQNAKLAIMYNTFKNKTQTEGTYNYLVYANQDHTTTMTIDWRWNKYDNSEMCMGFIRPSWVTYTTKGSRYFAGSQELFRLPSSAGSTFGYYGQKDSNGKVLFGRETPTGGAGGLKGWYFNSTVTGGGSIGTVVQSMDVDDATGDCYFIQEKTTSATSLKTKFPSVNWTTAAHIVTRVAMGGAETQMYLSHNGHGSNLAVTNFNGKLYVVTGVEGTDGGTAARKIGFIPWSPGKAIDTREGYNSVIKYLNNSWNSAGAGYKYPAIDNDNRLLCVASRKGSNYYYAIFDLDDAFNNPSTAKPIKIWKITVRDGINKMSGSSRAYLAKNDQGFRTWDDQGFTISGDYIYHYEGCGNTGSSDAGVKVTDGQGVVVVNYFNWRTEKQLYRTAVLADPICSPSTLSGEPESFKVHRDKDGRPSALIGIVTGSSGARKYNLHSFRQKTYGTTAGDGQGFAYTIAGHTTSADKSSVSLTSDGASASDVVTVSNNLHVRGITAVIVGADGESFSVSKTSGGASTSQHVFNVTFTPNRYKRNYSAFLRVSSPNTTDIMIPLSGSYTGTLAGNGGTEPPVVTKGTIKAEASPAYLTCPNPDGKTEFMDNGYRESTVTVTANGISGDISASISGDNDKELTITPAKLGSEGGTFTVRYTPTVKRDSYFKPVLTISASNADPVSITLFCKWDGTKANTGGNTPVGNGTIKATVAPAYLTCNSTIAEFMNKGYRESTVTVTATNVSGDIIPKFDGDTDNELSITPAKLGSEGGTFTVRYTPTIIRSAYLKPTLTLTASNAKSDPATFFLIWDGTQSTTGVDSIEADVAADDIWYNLQGVRIDTENLTPGLYIRVRAGKSTKVMLR